MRYKQKLAVVEAFRYGGDFEKLSAWFLKSSIRTTLPFFHVGRELHVINRKGVGTPIVIGSYIILSPDKKSVEVKTEAEFEASYAPLKQREKRGE